MSGSLVFLSGVGTQMMIASHSCKRSKSVVARSRPVSTESLIRSEVTSPMYDRPAFISAAFFSSTSNPTTLKPWPANSVANGNPT